MAKLTSKARKNLPAVEFAGPNRSYPIPDASHAANAKARATQQVKAGNLSPSTAASIKAKANRKLASSKSGSTGHPSERISAGSGRDHYKPKR
jgi:hypothetical protein